jgi:MFS family permease
MFLTNIGFGVILPTLPFLSQHLGASAIEMSLAISVFSVASLFAGVVWGAVSDRIGRRQVLIMGVVGYGVTSALLALVPNVATLLLLRFFSGVMAAAVFPSSLALVTNWTTPEERPRILGIMGSVNGIGFICGPPVGAFLSVFGIQVPFLCVGLLSIVNGLLAFQLLPRTSGRTDGHSEGGKVEARKIGIGALLRFFRNKMIAPLLLGTLVISIVDASISATLSYFIVGPLQSNETMAGWAFMITAGVSSLIQATVFSRVFERLGDIVTIVIGFGFGTLGYLLLGMSQYVAWAFLSLAIVSVCRGLAFPSITTSISLHAPVELQGSSFGAHSTVGSLGRTIGPLLAGWMYTYEERSPYFLASGLLFATLVFYLVWMNRMRKMAQGKSASVQDTM